ncbi:MAG: ATP-binding protein [Clostridiales bacterium]|nr:ATP-binding protein [Clostridiales bacterium]
MYDSTYETQPNELWQINRYMKLMLGATDSVFLLLDREARILYCSDNIAELLGIDDTSQIIGKYLGDLHGIYDDRAYAERSRQRYMRLLSGESDFIEEDVIYWPNKGQRLFSIHHKLVQSEENGVDAIALVMRDVTDKNIQDENKRIADRMQASQMPCMVWDEEGRVVECNGKAMELFCFSESFPAFEYITSTIQPDRQPDGTLTEDVRQQLIREALFSGYAKIVVHLKRSDGAPLCVEVTGVRVSWQYGHRLFVYFLDMTEVKAREAEAKEAEERIKAMELQREKMQAAAEAKSQFFASMSHELRTPLNTIIGLLELLRTDNLDQEQKSYIKETRRMSSVLLQTINDILDFHKIEAGKLTLMPVHFNLYTLVSNLVSMHKFLAESKGLTFNSQFAPELPRLVFGDELRLRQIVTNLIANAIKYTQKGYINFNVDVAVKDGKEYIVFRIEDSGIGIKEENLPILFNEFERFDSHKNRGIAGTGLGLAISKRLAVMMDGEIEVESEYGKGSVFTFFQPLIRGKLEQIAPPTEIERVVAKPDTKVLVVDDNAGNITVAIGLLARHGIIPQTAVDGEEAIGMIKANRYDLVFMDHMMPGMDGVEATLIVRALGGDYFSNLPIIALTANAVDSAKELFFEGGMNDFISKPIDVKELNRVLKKWLPKHKVGDRGTAEAFFELPEDEAVPYKLLEELMAIPDLNVVNGLSQVSGDKRLYVDILWQFCKSAENDIAALKNFAKNSQWKYYGVKVHALKSVFANIGNQFMSDWAFSLENAAMRGDMDKCLSETANFCNSMLLFYHRVEKTGIIADISSLLHKERMSAEVLHAKLLQLLLACNDFHSEMAEPIVSELSTITVNTAIDEQLMNIHDLVLSFDYDQAAKIIEELLELHPDKLMV